ncbi:MULTISPECIES: hypothetical protein [unclassified Sphingomonas]|jgi:hypothetical protein|uniref:hypothetical protein n=1 Tax=unclassified Sphingomonas TaxID=196159 RepID=UPI000E10123D|nr:MULTISPECIES: hypothetical protein [unclassified Sphingomonas]AXJ94422.1 hypothetical protein DM480_01870 [Sphingomonas sp. FARSPH]
MLGAFVFTYGMLASFVLQGVARNRKVGRPNPPMLEYVGYVLCGLSVGLSAMLLLMAFTAPGAIPIA